MNIATRAFPIIAVLMFFAFPTALGLANTLLLPLLIAWLCRRSFKEDWADICSNHVVLSALVLYGVILLGATYSSAPMDDVLLHIKKYSKLLFVPLLFCALKEPKWQRRGLFAFCTAMLFILVSTWLNVWFLLPWSASQELGWGVSHHVFGDYITQNVMMSFFVLVCLTLAYLETSRAKQIALALVAIFAAVSITHLSTGRTGYVLLIVALLTFFLTQFNGKKRWLAVVAMMLAVGFALLSSDLVEQRFHQAIEEIKHKDADNTTSIGHRLHNYQTTAALIQDSPLVGKGTGSYHTEICDFAGEPGACERFIWHPHNQFLFFGADQGTLGVIAYAFFLVSMLLLAIKSTDTFSRTLLFGLAFLLVTDSLFNSPLWSARESHFFLFMAALLAAMNNQTKKYFT